MNVQTVDLLGLLHIEVRIAGLIEELIQVVSAGRVSSTEVGGINSVISPALFEVNCESVLRDTVDWCVPVRGVVRIGWCADNQLRIVRVTVGNQLTIHESV